MVQREGLGDKLHVSAKGTGQMGHAGSVLLAGVADRVGLSRALSVAMASTREPRAAHDPGLKRRISSSLTSQRNTNASSLS